MLFKAYALVFAGLIAAASAASAAAPAVGQPFPNLAAFDLKGDLPDISDARVVIVDFWASWCPPCKASFPVFDELHEEFADQGVVIIAVSIDRNEKAMNAFLKKAAPKFSVVHDAGQKLVREVKVPVMPTSYVLDGRGVLRFVHEGFHGDKSRRQYIEEIKALLAEQAS